MTRGVSWKLHIQKQPCWRSLKRIRSKKHEPAHNPLIPTLIFRGHEAQNLFQPSDFPFSYGEPMEAIFRGIKLLVAYAYFYSYKQDEGYQQGNGILGAFASLNNLLNLVELSRADGHRHIMLDALRALSIILSSTTPEDLPLIAMKGGVIQLLLPILEEYPTDKAVTREVVLSLGNMCAEDTYYRDLVLEEGGMTALLAFLDDGDLWMNRMITWAISNLCYGKPQPLFEEIKFCLPLLINILEESSDLKVLSNVFWTLSFMSNTSNENINFIVQSGISSYVLQINEPSLFYPTVLTVGNILTGNDSECDTLLDHGVIPWLQNVASYGLKNKIFSLCSSVSRAISNIASRGGNYVEVVINGGFVQTLIEVLDSKPPSKVKRYVASALSYIVYPTTSHSNRLLVHLFPLLNSSSPRLLVVCLKCLTILVGEEHRAVGDEAYNNILKLLSHNHPEIKAKAKELVMLVRRA